MGRAHGRWPALIIALLGLGSGLSRAEVLSEYELKAQFLYQFARFVTWPNTPVGQITLCLYGADPFGGRLAEFDGRTVDNLTITVKYPATLEAAKACHVLFLNPRPAAELASSMQALNDLPILTVSDLPNAWGEKVRISLVTEPNRISFRINLTAARRSGLTISSDLLKLARDLK